MVKVYTSTLRYSGPDRLDITVKGQDPEGVYFAPTWEMVMGLKNRSITEMQYEERYRAMMTVHRLENTEWWEEFMDRDRVVLVCFCPKGNFCHRHILAKILVELGASFGGEI